MRSNRKSTFSLILLCLSLALAGCGPSDQPPDASAADTSPPSAPKPQEEVVQLTPAPSVPYVPTPREVVTEMLKMANVNSNDVVYDLGSGDGRIVITAAQQYGARGVGYELNEELIQEARENARQAGVSERVQFVREDLFEADLSEATVVTLYLLSAVNLKLRPKLLRELRPGTRIVSHEYGMGDWEPLETRGVETATSEHKVLYWTVPEERRVKSE
ncbi:MAG: SAM-dependent methyltransferase [Acidobacteriota bacterium]